MQNFTYSDYKALSKEEKELNQLLKSKKENEMKGPDKKTIDNVLAYSKAYSVRPSEHLDFIAHLLN